MVLRAKKSKNPLKGPCVLENGEVNLGDFALDPGDIPRYGTKDLTTSPYQRSSKGRKRLTLLITGAFLAASLWFGGRWFSPKVSELISDFKGSKIAEVDTSSNEPKEKLVIPHEDRSSEPGTNNDFNASSQQESAESEQSFPESKEEQINVDARKATKAITYTFRKRIGLEPNVIGLDGFKWNVNESDIAYPAIKFQDGVRFYDVLKDSPEGNRDEKGLEEQAKAILTSPLESHRAFWQSYIKHITQGQNQSADLWSISTYLKDFQYAIDKVEANRTTKLHKAEGINITSPPIYIQNVYLSQFSSILNEIYPAWHTHIFAGYNLDEATQKRAALFLIDFTINKFTKYSGYLNYYGPFPYSYHFDNTGIYVDTLTASGTKMFILTELLVPPPKELVEFSAFVAKKTERFPDAVNLARTITLGGYATLEDLGQERSKKITPLNTLEIFDNSSVPLAVNLIQTSSRLKQSMFINLGISPAEAMLYVEEDKTPDLEKINTGLNSASVLLEQATPDSEDELVNTLADLMYELTGVRVTDTSLEPQFRDAILERIEFIQQIKGTRELKLTHPQILALLGFDFYNTIDLEDAYRSLEFNNRLQALQPKPEQRVMQYEVVGEYTTVSRIERREVTDRVLLENIKNLISSRNNGPLIHPVLGGSTPGWPCCIHNSYQPSGIHSGEDEFPLHPEINPNPRIVAPVGGVVVYIGNRGPDRDNEGLGPNTVVIYAGTVLDANNNPHDLYVTLGHMKSLSPKLQKWVEKYGKNRVIGKYIEAGELLGQMGDVGYSEPGTKSAHLHWDILAIPHTVDSPIGSIGVIESKNDGTQVIATGKEASNLGLRGFDSYATLFPMPSVQQIVDPSKLFARDAFQRHILNEPIIPTETEPNAQYIQVEIVDNLRNPGMVLRYGQVAKWPYLTLENNTSKLPHQPLHGHLTYYGPDHDLPVMSVRAHEHNPKTGEYKYPRIRAFWKELLVNTPYAQSGSGDLPDWKELPASVQDVVRTNWFLHQKRALETGNGYVGIIAPATTDAMDKEFNLYAKKGDKYIYIGKVLAIDVLAPSSFSSDHKIVGGRPWLADLSSVAFDTLKKQGFVGETLEGIIVLPDVDHFHRQVLPRGSSSQHIKKKKAKYAKRKHKLSAHASPYLEEYQRRVDRDKNLAKASKGRQKARKRLQELGIWA